MTVPRAPRHGFRNFSDPLQDLSRPLVETGPIRSNSHLKGKRMSITKKTVVTVAAILITVGVSTASFAMRKSAGDSAAGAGVGDSTPPVTTQPVVICIYVFGGQICVSG